MKLTKQCFLVSALANRNINELKEPSPPCARVR